MNHIRRNSLKRPMAWTSLLVLFGLGTIQATPPLAPGVDYSRPNYGYSPPLRKFVDGLPGMTPAGKNNLGQYIPVAEPDKNAYPGSDYYEIGLVEYREQIHSDLPPVLGLSKTDPNAVGGVRMRGYVQERNGVAVSEPHYLGPWIVATSGRPVRVKFTNRLPAGSRGKLFLPVDTTVMGSGLGPDGQSLYPENRATLHLHGGLPAWISDGTPHQWTAPAGEPGAYTRGVGAQNVPDMDVPGDGSITFYWPNTHSGRMLWYHDHSYGLTRLNVYAGEAAGYLVVDPDERQLTAGMPEIPLVIQDKTLVPNARPTGSPGDPGWNPNWGLMTGGAAQVQGLNAPEAGDLNTDPLWDVNAWGKPGELWFPHVYMPNQDPTADTGALDWGRWDYGPWFWPPWPVAPGSTPPTTSIVPESFHDTPLVNGTPYPYLEVDPGPVRLRVLNACNERGLNLQWYVADPAAYTDNVGNTFLNTEVRMLPASDGLPWPDYFPLMAGQDRAGGVPDPGLAGPAWIQIGNEAGVLPRPALIKNVPIGFEYFRRTIVVLNVKEHALAMGPAERADVIVDFTPYAGQTLILYNDAPAPWPAFDTRNDHYTGNPDQMDVGGSPGTQPGWGPNTRTIMQVRVRGNPVGSPSPAPWTPGTLPVNYHDPALLASMQSQLPNVFKKTQEAPIVPQPQYDTAGFDYAGVSGGNAPLKVAHIQDTSITYIPYGSTQPITAPFAYKAIHELFDPIGRMNAVLGTELPFTSAYIQTTIPLAYIDPATEVLAPGETQFWWLTHNGVDTHFIHFHLVDVQVINRVGWDGAVSNPPIDENEYGWKETVRMNPLENILVAVRAKTPQVPFGVPESIRLMDVTQPVGTTNNFSGVDPFTGSPMVVTNQWVNHKWEYIWHCHLLGHEENDMMRPIVYTYQAIAPQAPTGLEASDEGGRARLRWVDSTPFVYSNQATAAETAANIQTLSNPANEIGFRLFRASLNGSVAIGPYAKVADIPANQTTWLDGSATVGQAYSYYVESWNAAGTAPSGVVRYPLIPPPSTPAGLGVSLVGGGLGVQLAWSDTATNTATFRIQRAQTGAGGVPGAWADLATVNAPIAGYRDGTVLIGATYLYQVRAENSGGASAYTASIAMGVVVPTAPTGLTATMTLGSGFASLNWNNTATNASGIVVQRATNAAYTGTLWTTALGATATGFTDSNPFASGAHTNYYRVFATNVVGNSTAGTQGLVDPGWVVPPTGLTATVANGPAVGLSWSNGGSSPAGWIIQRAANNTFTSGLTSYVIAGSTTTFTNTGMTYGSSYYYRVAATNGAAASTFSTALTVVIPALPADPSSLSATVSTQFLGRTVTLNWALPAGAANPSAFAIQRATDAAFTQNLNNQVVAVGTSRSTSQIGVTALSIPPLPGVKYWYRIRTYNTASPAGTVTSGWRALSGSNVAADGSITP